MYKTIMQIQGTITHVLPEANGVSKTTGNAWRKQEAVLQTNEQYPKSICFQMFNDRIVPLQVGQQVAVDISIESREYQGRWYTNINAWSVGTPAQQQPASYQQAPQAGQVVTPQPQMQQPQSVDGMLPSDDLPF